MIAISYKMKGKVLLVVEKPKCSGFTLIELMITVVIVAILAGVAYPSYQQYVVRSHRSAAQQFMLDTANREEEYFLNNRVYGDLTALGVKVPDDIGKFYTITVTPDMSKQPPNYTIDAAPKSGTSQSSDGTLSLDQRGVKTPADKWK